MKKFKKITQDTEFWVFIIIVILSLIIQVRSGQFFTNNNIVDIIRSMIYPAMGAICALLAFVSTGPDVSFPMIGACSSFLAIAITKSTGFNGPWIFVYLIAIIFGAIMGAVNGFLSHSQLSAVYYLAHLKRNVRNYRLIYKRLEVQRSSALRM